MQVAREGARHDAGVGRAPAAALPALQGETSARAHDQQSRARLAIPGRLARPAGRRVDARLAEIDAALTATAADAGGFAGQLGEPARIERMWPGSTLPTLPAGTKRPRRRGKSGRKRKGRGCRRCEMYGYGVRLVVSTKTRACAKHQAAPPTAPTAA